MNFYTWLTHNEDNIDDQELMLGRRLRRSELHHLYNLEYPNDNLSHTRREQRRAIPSPVDASSRDRRLHNNQ